jgi:Protein of unknown function (DUF4238)
MSQMKRRANDPKKHHFIPRSYLARFTDTSGFLHVFDRTSDQWRRQQPKEVMHIRDYYRQEWAPAGVDQNIFEKSLGEWLENTAKNAVDCLILAPSNLTEQYFAMFLVYLELQRLRVPRQAKMAMVLMRDTILRLAPPDIIADIHAGKFQLTMKKSARFDYMRMMVGQFHPWFSRMEWEVIEAEKGSAFVTTDSPLSLYNAGCPPPAEAGIALAGTRVLFPLDSRHLLVMRHPEYRKDAGCSPLEVLPDPIRGDGLPSVIRERVMSRRLVTNHNRVMALLSDRLIVSESREILEQCAVNLGKCANLLFRGTEGPVSSAQFPHV